MTKNNAASLYETSEHILTAAPGYLLCKPYIKKDTSVFKTGEIPGEDKVSEVLAVGAPVVDTSGQTRVSPCFVGDVVIHADTNKTFEINYTAYRFVHFSEFHGLLKVKGEK